MVMRSPVAARLWLAGLAGLCLLLAGCGWGRDRTAVLEEELARAGAYLDALNFRFALPIYAAVYRELPVEDSHWLEAAFGYANCLWHVAPPSRQNINRAIEVFERIAAEAPGTDWAAAARLSLARIEMLRNFPGDQENPAGAIPILERLLDEAEGPIRHEAMLRLAECHRMDFDNPESLRTARALLTGWLERYPDNPLASVMWEQVGLLDLLSFNDPAGALAALMQAEAIGFGDPGRKGQLLWRMAVLGEQTGRMDLAVRYYQKLILEVPASGRAYEAQQALQRIRDTVPGMEAIEVPDLHLLGGPST